MQLATLHTVVATLPKTLLYVLTIWLPYQALRARTHSFTSWSSFWVGTSSWSSVEVVRVASLSSFKKATQNVFISATGRAAWLAPHRSI